MKHNWVKFLPLLIIYIVIVLAASSDSFWGDEGRYVMFASNLSQGFYSPADDIYLWNGPGYPLILLPFKLFNVPWLAAKLVNALFLFGGVLYFYHTLCLYMIKKHSFFISYLLGLYPAFLKHIPFLLTEILAIFLVCGFLYHICKFYKNNRRSWLQLLLASLCLGYLALTKIFFGYVLLFGVLLFLFLFLWKRRDEFKQTFFVYLLALMFCLPYLFYTYALTGKVFYWGNSGGLSLYWMSTPYDDEFGDWIQTKEVYENSKLFKNHGEFFSKIDTLSSMQKDEALKKQAIKNIMNHPSKYIINWLANIGRLLFNYPYSYDTQKLTTYFYIIPNIFLVVASVVCIYPAYRGRKLIPYELYVLLVFCGIYLGGSSLLSAYNRQFQLVVPVIVLWLSYISNFIIRVEMKH